MIALLAAVVVTTAAPASVMPDAVKDVVLAKKKPKKPKPKGKEKEPAKPEETSEGLDLSKPEPAPTPEPGPAAVEAAEPVVAGGATIYEALLPLVGRVHRTTIAVDVPDADTWFPDLPPSGWQLVTRRPGVDERLTFDVLDRIEV